MSSRASAALAVLAVGVSLGVGPAAGASPVAPAARGCSPPKYPGVGYFTSLTVKGVGCATGRKLALAYYHCRTRT